MVQNSLKTILLADTSKFNQAGLYTYANYADIDMLICERAAIEEESSIFPEALLIYTKS